MNMKRKNLQWEPIRHRTRLHATSLSLAQKFSGRTQKDRGEIASSAGVGAGSRRLRTRLSVSVLSADFLAKERLLPVKTSC